MSTDQVISEIQNTQSLARQIATSSIAATTTLVTEAVQTLTRYTPEFPQEPITIRDSGVSVGNTNFTPDEKPPNFPAIRVAQDVRMGALGDIDTIDATFDEPEPTITIPSFSFDKPSALGDFNESIPDIDGSVDIPNAPTLAEPDAPTLIPIDTSVGDELQDIVIPPLDIKEPGYANVLSDSFVAQFAAGKAALPNADDYGNSLVSRFFPQWQPTINQLSARINGVLGGTQTALTDSFDGWLYETARTRINDESQKAIEALDEQTTATGWDLPGATRAAGIRRITEAAQQALQTAALDVYTKRTEREVQHLQYVMGQALPLHQAAIALFAQGFDMSMKAFDAAMRYADTAMRFSVEVYRVKQQDYIMALSLIDKKIAIFQALLDAELAKTKVTEARLTVERLKAEVNQQNVQLYTAQLDAQRTKVDIYQKQIAALEATITARKLPLDIFESKIRAFAAKASAKRDQYTLVDAQIRASEGELKGELAKLDAYTTKANVFSTLVGARSKKIDGQIQRNRQVLDEFKIRQDAEVQLTQIDAAVAEHALNAYVSMAHVYIAESNQLLEAARLDFQQVMEQSKLDLANRQFAMDIEFKNLEVEMTLMKATADMQLSAAEVNGRVGSAAMSVMNTMAGLSASVSE